MISVNYTTLLAFFCGCGTVTPHMDKKELNIAVAAWLSFLGIKAVFFVAMLVIFPILIPIVIFWWLFIRK